MRKIFWLITLLLIFPLVVIAAEGVGPTTPTREFETKAECESETIAKNLPGHVQNATAGWLLTCSVVSCKNSSVSYENVKEPNAIVSCANGNTNMWTDLSLNPIGAEYPIGSSCNAEFEGPIFTGLRYQFDCTKLANGSPYTPSDQTPTTPAPPNGNNNGGTTQNPQTNISTYYAVLSVAIVVLSLALYVVNKKNVFKKM